MTKTCASDGCERRAKSLGLCLKHWQRAYATRQDGPRCKADGCKRAAICLGLCAAHYQRQRQHGDVAAHQPVETYELWSPEEDALLARVLASVPPSGRVEDGTWPDVALILARTHGVRAAPSNRTHSATVWTLRKHGKRGDKLSRGVPCRPLYVWETGGEKISRTQSEPSQWKPDSEYKTTGCSSAR